MRTPCRFHNVSALLGLTLLLSAGVARADDWIAVGADAAHTRLTAERSGPAFAAGGWTYALPDGAITVSSPAVADGFVVFAAFDGVVRALRAADGQLAWQAKLGDTIYAGPAIYRGKAFVPSTDRKLYAFRLTDGSVLWTKQLDGLEMASPVIADDAIIVSAGFPERRIMKLDASTGATLWVTPSDVLAQFSNTAAAISGDQVIVGANGGHYYSFDLGTGALRWSYEANGIVNLSAPIVVGNAVFMLPGGTSWQLHGVDLTTGQALPGWPVTLPTAEVDVAGTFTARQLAASSLASAAGRLVFDVRQDDYLDTDKDGVPDRFRMRESLMAVDIATATIAWTQPNGSGLVADGNAVPKFWLCPTPAIYQTASGPLVAAMSTTSPVARILDLSSGADLWRVSTGGISQASPALANGRLFVGNMTTLSGLLSSANQPPAVPQLLGQEGRSVSNVAPMLRWTAAFDPEQNPVSYQLRVDHDGEVLETWEHEVTVAAGQTSTRLPFNLTPGTTYVVAMRARDSQGAWSDWSAPQTLTATETPTVTLDGNPVADLLTAIQTAQPGSVIKLGPGTYNLTETMHLGAGVTVSGEGPSRTVLSGRGLGNAVTIEGNIAGKPAQLTRMTVADATIGILVQGTQDAVIKNVIVRDNAEAGVEISASGSAQLVNDTLIRDGKAIKAFGAVTVRNTIVTKNDVGFWSQDARTITSRFNDLYANTSNFHQVDSGLGDFGAAVTWVDLAGGDFHLTANQPSTDRGDPADDFSLEPLPNGGRINLGAFGGTAEAELSATDDPSAPTPAQTDAGGCTVAATSTGSSPVSPLAALAIALGVVLRRRPRGR